MGLGEESGHPGMERDIRETRRGGNDHQDPGQRQTLGLPCLQPEGLFIKIEG